MHVLYPFREVDRRVGGGEVGGGEAVVHAGCEG
jgi:hypothetical protein